MHYLRQSSLPLGTLPTPGRGASLARCSGPLLPLPFHVPSLTFLLLPVLPHPTPSLPLPLLLSVSSPLSSLPPHSPHPFPFFPPILSLYTLHASSRVASVGIRGAQVLPRVLSVLAQLLGLPPGGAAAPAPRLPGSLMERI